jgi:periplasmic divalent cation tolerance protein
MGVVWVYMTAADMAEARRIGKTLVELHLAACINILDAMRSIYRWQGNIQEDQEVILIAKTTDEKVAALKKKVAEIHSYECPCVLVFPVSDGHAPFIRWIEDQVGARE